MQYRKKKCDRYSITQLNNSKCLLIMYTLNIHHPHHTSLRVKTEIYRLVIQHICFIQYISFGRIKKGSRTIIENRELIKESTCIYRMDGIPFENIIEFMGDDHAK